MPRIRPKKFHCTYESCKTSCESQYKLDTHLRTHSNERPFICDSDDCTEAFKQKAHLKTHIQLKHSDEKLFQCEFGGCDASFKTKDGLRVHSVIHNDDRPYKCQAPECTASFKLSSGLKKHTREVHDKTKDVLCDECNKAFFSNSDLKEHMNTHTETKPYKCPIEGCDASFTYSTGIRAHLLVHDESRPYLCPFKCCDKSYKQKKPLQIHLLTHGDSRPYKCEYPDCHASFNYPNVLKMHIATHEDERPFACPRDECEQKFRRQHHLENHLRWHDDNKEFSCTVQDCDAAFIQEAHLATHIKTYHTEEGQQIKKKKEQAVAKALDAAEINYKREHQVAFECFGGTFARTDFLIVKDGGVLIIEIDEDQHQAYGMTCEMSRMINIISAVRLEGNTLPIGIIRYNPDPYLVNDKKQRKLQKTRESQLVKVITDWQFGSPGSFEIQYMFYDIHLHNTDSNCLVIWDDPDYNNTILECCRPPII